MGNRCVIHVKNHKASLYLHWEGSPNSVVAFLDVAKALRVRAPDNDPRYFLSRFAQIIGNYFGGTLSLGILDEPQSEENGCYTIWSYDRVTNPTLRSGFMEKARKSKQYEQVYRDTMHINAGIFSNGSRDTTGGAEVLI